MKTILIALVLIAPLFAATAAAEPLPDSPFVCMPEDPTLCDAWEDPAGWATGRDLCKIGNEHWC